MSWPCPVCKTPVVVDYNHCGEGVQLEYEDHCPNGCIWSHFAYGMSEECIGEKHWQWSYLETPEEELKRRQERNAAIKELQDAKQRPVPEGP